MERWLKLYPKTLENPIVMKDSNHLAVWTFCLMNASWTDTKGMLDGQQIPLHPGEFIMSFTEMSNLLKIPRSTLQRVVNDLEKSGQMLGIWRGSKSSVFSVLNWAQYQEGGQMLGRQWADKRVSS